MTVKSDAELLRDHDNGDAKAFGVLYDRHARGLFAYLLSSVKQPADAQELLQQTFIKIFQSARKLTAIENLRGYFYQIARRCAIDYYRRNPARRERPLEAAAHLITEKSASRATHATHVTEDAQLARQMLFSLPEDQRETVTLRLFSDLSFREIADAVDSNINTVVYRYNAAIQKLKERYRDRFE